MSERFREWVRFAESGYWPDVAGLNLERAMQFHPDAQHSADEEPSEQFALVDAADQKTAEREFGADFDDEAVEASHG